MIYLDKETGLEKFNSLLAGAESEFFKFECLPSYFDYGIDNWNRLSSEEIYSYIIKAQKAILAESDKFLAPIKKGGVSRRVRFFEFPMSKYILRQFSVYSVFVEIGVDIQLLEGFDGLEGIPKHLFRDFMIFDDSSIILPDNPNGNLAGWIFSDKPEDVQEFIAVKNILNSKSVPFQKFIKDYNLKIDVLVD
jgi:hypothetical protein